MRQQVQQLRGSRIQRCLGARKRAQELEEGIAQISAELARSRKGLEASRADNLALVERLKFVQGYQAQGKSFKGAPSPTL